MLDPLTVFRDAKKAGAGWVAKCPGHDDRKASLSIGTGADNRVLLKCHAGCELDDILAAAHLEHADLFPQKSAKADIVATYPYRDEGGAHLFDVVRLAPKDFRQRAADGTWSTKGVRKVLYRLPELQGQTIAYVIEGEKDADRLRAIGLPGTTNAGGAGKWRPEYCQQLTAATIEHVVILPDNDEPGRAHAEQVAAACHAAGLHTKIVALPNLPPKGDVSDWLDAGHTKAELVALVKVTALYTPNATAQTDDLALTTLDALLAEPDDAIEWEIDGLIASGSLNLLAGKPKAGKSTLARQMALCMATGAPFLDRACVGGLVWYLVLEDKRSEVRRHFRALGATGSEPVRFLFGNTRDLLAKLSRLAGRERPRAIIIDTLQRLINAKDLNDYAEVTTRLEPVLAIARTTGAAVILVHHAAKADRAGVDSVLGSTALTGSVDNVFLLNRTERYRLLSSIQRIGTDLEETVLGLDDDGRIHGGQSRHAADVGHIERSLREALEASPSLSREEWFDAIEGRKQIKLQAFKRIIESGTTISTGTGKKGDPLRYSIDNSGSQVPSNSREPESSFPSLVRFPKPSRDNSGSQVPADLDSGSRLDGPAFSFDPGKLSRVLRGEEDL